MACGEAKVKGVVPWCAPLIGVLTNVNEAAGGKPGPTGFREILACVLRE